MTCTGTLSVDFAFDVDQHTIGSTIACSSPCTTCVGSASFCLTCKSPQLASSGECASTCPTGTFLSSGACLKCHPDCQNCTGASFEKCSACFPSRPVLSSGRCLPTCVESQFFDVTSSTCQDCDPSCLSCSGPGLANCLACSSPTQVLRAGSCVSVDCVGSSNVLPDLGVCLSDLVQGSSSTNTTTISPSSAPTSVPTDGSTGSATSSVGVNNGRSRRVTWWEILLSVLGGVVIIIVIFVLWRRRMRKQRVEETVKFVSTKERVHLRQIRDKWLGNLKKDEFYHPEGISMAHRDDFDLRNPVHVDLDHHRDSRSVYSQDVGMAWHGHHDRDSRSLYSQDVAWQGHEHE